MISALTNLFSPRNSDGPPGQAPHTGRAQSNAPDASPPQTVDGPACTPLSNHRVPRTPRHLLPHTSPVPPCTPTPPPPPRPCPSSCRLLPMLPAPTEPLMETLIRTCSGRVLWRRCFSSPSTSFPPPCFLRRRLLQAALPYARRQRFTLFFTSRIRPNRGHHCFTLFFTSRIRPNRGHHCQFPLRPPIPFL